MRDGGFEVIVERSWDRPGMQIWFLARYADGTEHVAKPMEIVFEPMPATGVRIEPSLTLSRHIADELLEAIQAGLTKAGVKPREVSKAEGLLEATKSHLEDMRAIVKKTMGADLPPDREGKKP
ncbi:MAG: hypothetical protein ACYDG4_13210 [Desulfuromonadaceae bacterium]